MKCQDCGAEMKPLATSLYCPNDCDRIVREEIDSEKTPKIMITRGQEKPSSEEDADTGLLWQVKKGSVQRQIEYQRQVLLLFTSIRYR